MAEVIRDLSDTLIAGVLQCLNDAASQAARLTAIDGWLDSCPELRLGRFEQNEPWLWNEQTVYDVVLAIFTN